MAYSDWDIVTYTSNGAVYVNGTGSIGESGGPRLHSALTDPLTASGDFCREYILQAVSTNARTLYSITGSLSGGIFTEVPDTKAISVRASVRMVDPTFTGRSVVAICAKGAFDITSTPNSTVAPPEAYSLVLGATDGVSNANSFKLVLRNNASQNGTGVTIDSVADNTWYHVRMDVTPVGTMQDRIEVYTGSEGSSTWDLVHTETVLNTDSYYIPWGASGAGKIGYWLVNSSTTNAGYIDNFEVYVVDV